MPSRWTSSDQMRDSLIELKRVHPYFGMTFLAFKAANLPVGTRIRLNFAALMRDFLHLYYKPSTTYSGYYNPFVTSNPSNRWVTSKYPSGALQRITVDTLGHAILHTKNQSRWGWRENYVTTLRDFQTTTRTRRIPVFHLAIWLYRDDAWDGPSALVDRFLTDFHISPHEHVLFALDPPTLVAQSQRRLTDRGLFSVIGWPPGETHGNPVTISSIDMRGVGPALGLHYTPSPRLNLITGDNSLGKTFLLECAWWAITGHWNDHTAAPRRDVHRSTPRIRYALNTSGRDQYYTFMYDFDIHSWTAVTPKLKPLCGLAIFARHDGSYAIWDPASYRARAVTVRHSQILLDKNSLWHGKDREDAHGRIVSICNGLLSDWVDWQTRSSQFEQTFDTFRRCLGLLSPPGEPVLEPDDPTYLPGDEREIPTLKMPYGAVPILHASAAVQRIVGLVYVVIWAWFRHQRNAGLSGRNPQDHLVLLVDEIEAHLHPRWQRSIVPALLEAVDCLSGELETQLHLASHSPLVLASIESIFEHRKDSLHHLELHDQYVSLGHLDFERHGSIDSWLRSDVFGLKHARSMLAEEAIERAKQLQLAAEPNAVEVRETDLMLARCLRDDDEFWPRWRYFAKQFLGEAS